MHGVLILPSRASKNIRCVPLHYSVRLVPPATLALSVAVIVACSGSSCGILPGFRQTCVTSSNISLQGSLTRVLYSVVLVSFANSTRLLLPQTAATSPATMVRYKRRLRGCRYSSFPPTARLNLTIDSANPARALVQIHPAWYLHRSMSHPGAS
jgi:hypothetical protein